MIKSCSRALRTVSNIWRYCQLDMSSNTSIYISRYAKSIWIRMPWLVEVIKIYNFLVDKSLPAVVFKGEDNWILWSDERAITDCINHVLKIEYSKSPKVQTNRWSILFRYFREHHQADLEDNISTHGLAVGDYGLLVLALHILSEKLQLLRFSVKSFSAFEIFGEKFYSFWDFQ